MQLFQKYSPHMIIQYHWKKIRKIPNKEPCGTPHLIASHKLSVLTICDMPVKGVASDKTSGGGIQNPQKWGP